MYLYFLLNIGFILCLFNRSIHEIYTEAVLHFLCLMVKLSLYIIHDRKMLSLSHNKCIHNLYIKCNNYYVPERALFFIGKRNSICMKILLAMFISCWYSGRVESALCGGISHYY